MRDAPLDRRNFISLAGWGGLAWALSRNACADEKSARPNILFAIADDWSCGHAGAYGCTWVKTPAFDRVAREGLLFSHAYTPNAKCAPSRSCVLTGRNPWQLKEAANHVPFFPAEFKVYPEALSEHGYFTGMTGKGWAPGVANDAGGKPRAMAGKPFSKRNAPPPAKGIAGNDYAANFTDFLDAAPKDQPWCFWYGGHEPHRGYEYGSGVAKGGKKISDLDRVPGYWPDNETVRNDMLDYAFEVEHFDRHLGRMLELLEQRGQLDNTLVVVTSDNGMPFPRSKGHTYQISNRMPLAVMWKKGIVKPGRTVDDYVSFIDFAPTFVDLAGIEWAATGMQPATGRSLRNIFQSEQAGRIDPARDHVLLGRERNDVGRPNDQGYPVRAILQDDGLYLRNFEPARWPACNPETGYLDTDGGPTKTEVLKTRTTADQKKFWDLSFGKRDGEELYDLKKDPDCLNNLIGQAEYQARKAQLEKRLMDALREQNDPRVVGQGSVFDNYPYSNEAQRNFYERFMRGEKVKAGWVSDSDFEKGPVE
jgi:arylsulfatase A-like enzyme